MISINRRPSNLANTANEFRNFRTILSRWNNNFNMFPNYLLTTTYFSRLRFLTSTGFVCSSGCEAFLSDLDTLPCIQIGDFKLRLELDDDLSPELKEIAAKELRESPEQQAKSIAELRALLESTYAAALFFVILLASGH